VTESLTCSARSERLPIRSMTSIGVAARKYSMKSSGSDSRL